jgi:hypothetical protein
MLHQDPNPESFALANTALHHKGEDSKPAAAVTAAPSNIVIPPSLQAALDQMLIRNQQNVPPSAPHHLAPPASCVSHALLRSHFGRNDVIFIAI